MYQQQVVVAIVVAAGSSSRMGFDKLLHPVRGTSVLCHTVQALVQHPYVDRIVVVAGDNLPKIQALFEENPSAKPLEIVRGGATRTASVAAGLLHCTGADIVAIHDGARPFVSQKIISDTIEAAAETGAAAPAVPVKDTIKMQQNHLITGTPPRSSLAAVQTPQVFGAALFRVALAAIPQEGYPNLTDDCMVMERAGYPVRLVAGELANIKITTQEDLPHASAPTQLRIGHGYDVHKLVPERRFIVGGVDIPYEKGLLGHSDADVLLHAVADALLGALALGDIGSNFPDTDAAYKNADSLLLLQQVAALAQKQGYVASNVDATILCQAPKLAPHIPAMRQNVARALGLPLGAVSVKATTEEGLGFTGRGDGVAAHCVVLAQKA